MVEFEAGNQNAGLMLPGGMAPPLASYMSNSGAYANMAPLIPTANFNGFSIQPLNNQARARVPVAPTPAILQPLPLIQAAHAAIGNTTVLRHGLAIKRKRERVVADLEDATRPVKRVGKVGTSRPTPTRTPKRTATKGVRSRSGLVSILMEC